MNETWWSIIVGLLAYCGAMVLHAFFFGNRIGSIETGRQYDGKRLDKLEELTQDLKTAVEVYTRISIKGIDFRKKGDH
jgi:hypothetical protein